MAHLGRYSRFGAGMAFAAACLSGVPLSSQAAEFFSVSEPAVMYDSPSDKGKRTYVALRYTPLEVVVKLDAWVKVRDMDGHINWIQKALLTQTRMVQANTLATVRQSPAATAPVAFQVERLVALELLEANPPGWAKVKHRDGTEGYARLEQLWGL